MTNNKVASYAERIERLLDERATIDADIKDIYQEVKSADLKPKVLRKAIANKRRKVDKQFEADVEEYAALLLALPGATYRSVAERTGIPKSTLQRRVPKRANGTEPPHDPETGEVGEVDCGSCGSSPHAETEPRTAPLCDPQRADDSTTTTTGEDHGSDHAEVRVLEAGGPDLRGPGYGREGGEPVLRLRDRQDDDQGNDGHKAQAPLTQSLGAEPRHTGEPVHDDLAIPAFLDRRQTVRV